MNSKLDQIISVLYTIATAEGLSHFEMDEGTRAYEVIRHLFLTHQVQFSEEQIEQIHFLKNILRRKKRKALGKFMQERLGITPLSDEIPPGCTEFTEYCNECWGDIDHCSDCRTFYCPDCKDCDCEDLYEDDEEY